MKRLKVFGWIIVVAFILAQAGFSQDLISAKDCASKISKSNVILVSTRKPADYQKVHIKGAVNVDLNGLYKTGDVKGLIKDAKEMASILGKSGINEKKEIIIYDAGTNVNAGRLYWILKYLGCPDVKLLNGHMKAWRTARKPVTKLPTKTSEVTFTPTVNQGIYASIKYVKDHLSDSNVKIVDARDDKEFGEGAIPGAIHIENKKVINEDGTLKSSDELTSIFKGAGVTPDKEVILYCASSARAGILFLALKSLNYSKVRVYDGAYNEWKVN